MKGSRFERNMVQYLTSKRGSPIQSVGVYEDDFWWPEKGSVWILE